MKNLIAAIIILHIFCPLLWASSIDLPRDASGWTVFTPSSDSRIVYVDPDNGNDGTGQVYAYDDFADPFIPSGENSYATYAAAFAQTRDGYPDWVLIKRGTTLVDQSPGAGGSPMHNGRSASEPFLLAAYGDSGATPTFKIAQGEYGIKNLPPLKWFVMSGIDFYAYKCNPTDPDYIEGGVNQTAVLIQTDGVGAVSEGILFEGCKFRYSGGPIVQAINQVGQGVVDGVTFRRCLFLDTFSQTAAHNQGLFVNDVQNLLIEECIFDHDGWYSQANSGGPGEATGFNHNMYLDDLRNAVIRNNVSIRPSSMHIKLRSDETPKGSDILIDNNLLVDGEIGVGTSSENPDRFLYSNITVQNNVISNIGRSRPTDRTLAWYINILNTDVGSVRNNLLINQELSANTNTIGLFTDNYDRNVNFYNNIVYNLQDGIGLQIQDDYNDFVSNMAFYNNSIQVASSSDFTIDAQYDVSSKWSFSGNKYYSDKSDGTRFTLENVDKTDAQWATATGDNSTFEQVSFTDSTRDVDTYMGHIGGTATIDGFIVAERAQDRYNWNPALQADAVNDWIRAGFDLQEALLTTGIAGMSGGTSSGGTGR